MERDPIRDALCLFRSVVHCGEAWTPTCEAAFNAAIRDLDKLRFDMKAAKFELEIADGEIERRAPERQG